MPPIRQAGSTISVSASTTSARTALSGFTGYYWVVNIGAVLTYVRFGDSSVVATAADTPIPPNTGLLLGGDPQSTHVAALTASSTAVAYVAPVKPQL